MFKFSKKFLSLILAILMLTMTAIGVNAEELIIGIDDLLEAVGIIEHDHEEEELIAVAATDSCGCTHIYQGISQLVHRTIQSEPCPKCGKKTTASFNECKMCGKQMDYKIKYCDCKNQEWFSGHDK